MIDMHILTECQGGRWAGFEWAVLCCLQGLLSFYQLPQPQGTTIVLPGGPPPPVPPPRPATPKPQVAIGGGMLPDGVQYELRTLPVSAIWFESMLAWSLNPEPSHIHTLFWLVRKFTTTEGLLGGGGSSNDVVDIGLQVTQRRDVGDGDGMTVYVEVSKNSREISIVPHDVQEALHQRHTALLNRDFATADSLKTKIEDEDYKWAPELLFATCLCGHLWTQLPKIRAYNEATSSKMTEFSFGY